MERVEKYLSEILSFEEDLSQEEKPKIYLLGVCDHQLSYTDVNKIVKSISKTYGITNTNIISYKDKTAFNDFFVNLAHIHPLTKDFLAGYE